MSDNMQEKYMEIAAMAKEALRMSREIDKSVLNEAKQERVEVGNLMLAKVYEYFMIGTYGEKYETLKEWLEYESLEQIRKSVEHID